MDALRKKVTEFVNNIGGVKTVMTAAVVLFVLSLISFVVYKNSGDRDYAVLYTHLNPDDAGSVLSVLQENRVPYEVKGDGSIILAPRDAIYDLRLKLAAQGIPRAKAVGLELFAEPKMGTTQFQENVNYLRGIEGELVRTIRRIDAVQDAKVNIALPKESIFVRDEEVPKASVIIQAWPGRELSREQVKAIVFLLSHAVPKLTAANVTVVDNSGRVLSDMLEEPDAAKSGDALANAKKQLEGRIEKNVQSMLGKALGAEKVVVRVAVDLETGSVRQKDELYDPDKTAVVSERKIQENGEDRKTTPSGVPGTATNVPAVTGQAGTATANSTKTKKDVTTNYDVSKSLIDTEKPIYAIKKLSIGVLIDGKYKSVKEGNGTESRTFIPRTEAELESYRSLIKSAVGFDEVRGDTISVISVPFEIEKESFHGVQEAMSEREMLMYGLLGAAGLIVLLLLLWLMKRLMKKAPERTLKSIEEPQATPAQVAEELQEAQKREGRSKNNLENNENYTDIIEIIDEHPEMMASLIGKWIKEEPTDKKK